MKQIPSNLWLEFAKDVCFKNGVEEPVSVLCVDQHYQGQGKSLLELFVSDKNEKARRIVFTADQFCEFVFAKVHEWADQQPEPKKAEK